MQISYDHKTLISNKTKLYEMNKTSWQQQNFSSADVSVEHKSASPAEKRNIFSDISVVIAEYHLS